MTSRNVRFIGGPIDGETRTVDRLYGHYFCAQNPPPDYHMDADAAIIRHAYRLDIEPDDEFVYRYHGVDR